MFIGCSRAWRALLGLTLATAAAGSSSSLVSLRARGGVPATVRAALFTKGPRVPASLAVVRGGSRVGGRDEGPPVSTLLVVRGGGVGSAGGGPVPRIMKWGFPTDSPTVVVLLLVHAATYLVQLSWKPGATELLLRDPAKIRQGQWYRLFTAAIAHANLEHLFIWSGLLGLAGSEIERFYGRKSFLALYLSSGLAGGALDYCLGNKELFLGSSVRRVWGPRIMIVVDCS
jgi:hypothetical protein